MIRTDMDRFINKAIAPDQQKIAILNKRLLKTLNFTEISARFELYKLGCS
jgi:hypothetical protein